MRRWTTLRREIATMWQTEEVRDHAVSPLDEVRGGLAVFEQTLWEALPRYMRQIDRALGEALALDAAPLRFGSWIGGDRDGNPNVTAGGHTQGDMDGAMDRRRPVLARDRRVARGAVARLGERRVASHRRRQPRTVSRAAARSLGAAPRDARTMPRPGSKVTEAAPAGAPAPLARRLRLRGAAAAVPSLARWDRQWSDRRRTPHRHPSTRRGVRPHAGAARPASGCGPPCRGDGVDRAASGIWDHTKTSSEEERIALLIGEIENGTRTFADLPRCRRSAGVGPRRARYLPNRRGAAERVARRLRHHDGQPRVGRPRGRTAAEARREPTSAAGGSAVRNRRRPSARRLGAGRAPGAPLVSHAHRAGSRRS